MLNYSGTRNLHCKNDITTKVVTFTTTLDHYSVMTSESLLLHYQTSSELQCVVRITTRTVQGSTCDKGLAAAKFKSYCAVELSYTQRSVSNEVSVILTT